MQKIFGVIPARFSSVRLPGKLLLPISGKTLLQWTWERAKQCSLFEDVLIATDDERIFKEAKSFEAKVFMTPQNIPSGTDRIVHLLRQVPSLQEASAIVIVQGDEPLLEREVMEKVSKLLIDDQEVLCGTAVTPLKEEKEALSPHVVKCVMDKNQWALYFSRAMIPYGKSGLFKEDQLYYRHLGIYAYRPTFLLHLASLPQTALQLAEDLEQLKVLENGYRIKVAIVESHGVGVDTREDLQQVERILCKQNISSSQAESAHP